MKTIAQQLKVTEFPFTIKDSQGKQIYFEDSNGFWWKSEFNAQGKEIYFENSRGYWTKSEFNSQGNEIYYENSHGVIFDNRPKKTILSIDEIAKKLNIPVNQLQIKK